MERKHKCNILLIPGAREHDPARADLLILDDVMLGPRNKAEAYYYTRGSHNNFEIFYIAQSYFQLPRQTVRENANFFIFFLQDKTNLCHIHNCHCSGYIYKPALTTNKTIYIVDLNLGKYLMVWIEGRIQARDLGIYP